MTIAITREVSSRFNECEITHIDRAPIDVNIARAEHHEYVKTLIKLGCQVIELPEEADLPDSVFVEDAAFILDEVAVITRPGADSRKLETDSIASALEPYRPLIRVTEPATVDGGDVLVLGKNIYVGMSTRSTPEAVTQLQNLLNNYGYKVYGVELTDCLHLKTAVTFVDHKTLLINKNWVNPSHFFNYELLEVDSAEPFAANCLAINGILIYPASFPKTQEKLEQKGFKVVTVNAAELAKAEGAVTCCSLIIK